MPTQGKHSLSRATLDSWPPPLLANHQSYGIHMCPPHPSPPCHHMPFRGTCPQQFWELDRPSSRLANTLPLGPKALSFDRKGITFCFVLDQSQAQKPDQLSKGKFHTVPCVHERKVNPLYRLAPSNCWWDWATGSLRCHTDLLWAPVSASVEGTEH